MRLGHNWILKFGNVAGSMRCIEKKFKLVPLKNEEYKGLRFRDCDYTLVVDVCLHRVDEDVSGLIFQEWDPSSDTDASQAPVTMIVKSLDLCVSDFDLREVIPLQLESVTRGGQRTRDTTLKVDPRHGYQEVFTVPG